MQGVAAFYAFFAVPIAILSAINNFFKSVFSFFSLSNILKPGEESFITITLIIVPVITVIIFLLCLFNNTFNQQNVKAFELSMIYIIFSIFSLMTITESKTPNFKENAAGFFFFIFLVVRYFLFFVAIPVLYVLSLINKEKLSIMNYYTKYLNLSATAKVKNP
jgi:hypothetical protein